MKPEASGMSSARLARLDEVMKRRYVDGGYLPGMLTYVYRKGQLVHTGMCGQMDIERGKPMREDAIFRIYSMSKPITAVALMMLVEEGLIGLDDARPQPHPGVEGPRRLRQRHAVAAGRRAAQLSDDAGPAADEGHRPRDPYLGPHLRLYDAHRGRRRLSPGQGDRPPDRRRARRDDRPAGARSRSISRRERRGIIRWRSTCWAISSRSCPASSFGEFLRTRLFEPLGMNDTAF